MRRQNATDKTHTAILHLFQRQNTERFVTKVSFIPNHMFPLFQPHSP